MSTETLLFSGTDLRTVCLPEDLNEFWATPTPRGDLQTYPGIDGAAPVDRPLASEMRNATVSVAADTFAEARDAVAAVKALLRVHQEQVVTRREVTTDGNLDASQSAIVRSADERWDGGPSCTLLVDVELLDGIWLGPSTNIAVAAGAHTIAGDVRTRRMTITLAAGPARTISNTRNGYYVQFLATVPAGGVLIDVAARKATAITGGADMSRYLKWGKAHLMQFEPGSNTLVLDAGAASIDYQPAYL